MKKQKHKYKKSKRKDKPKNSGEPLNRHKQDGRPILLTRVTLRVLLRLPKPLNRNCIFYYLLLLLLCVERKTNRVWCNDSYAAKVLNCSLALVKKAKAQLVKLGYIRIEQEHGKETGKFGKSYIVCKHYARRNTIDTALKLYSQTSRSGNFYTEETLEDLLKRAENRMTKQVRSEKRAKQKQSTVTTKNVPTGGTSQKAGSPKKTSNRVNKTVSTKNVLTVKKKQSTVGTKNRETVKRTTNTYRAKEDNTYRTKENTLAKRKSEGVSDDLFDDSKDKLKPEGKDSFEYKCSIQLCNALKSKGKVGRVSNFKEWPRHFRELMQFKTKRRIKIVLGWYLKHFTERWCPKLYCARTFKENFARIEDAMRRKGDENLLEDEREEETEVDDFSVETKEWTDEDGVRRGRDSIDYGEPEQDEDEEDEDDD